MVALSCLTNSATGWASSGKNGPKIRDVAPPLTLRKIVQGPSVNDVSWEKLKGKVVVLEFWETTCVPCMLAVPHLNQLVEQFKEKPVVFLSISGENEGYVREILKSRPISGLIGLDKLDKTTYSAYDVQAIPHTVIVDATGKIAAITHPTKLEARHLDEVLAGKPCSAPPLPPISDDNDEVVAVDKLAGQNATLVEVSMHGPFPMPNGAYGLRGWKKNGFRFEAEKAGVKDILTSFYRISPQLTIEHAAIPDGLYDVVVTGPPDRSRELQEQFAMAVKSAFGLIVRTNSRSVDVYELNIGSPDAPGRTPAAKFLGGQTLPGGFLLRGMTISQMQKPLETALSQPIFNESQNTNLWNWELHWEMTDGEKLLVRLGFDLKGKEIATIETFSPENLPVEIQTKIKPDDLVLLKAELRKPLAQRFRPDPARVIRAAREQLGLDLTPTVRTLTVLEIRAAD